MNKKILRIDGIEMGLNQIMAGRVKDFPENSFQKKTINIIRNWETGKQEFTFPTSGSTGKPKMINISRSRIKSSAESTLKFINPGKGSFLLCLDPGFIAGFMMIIRALISETRIIAIEPVSNPLLHLPENETVSLAALVPLQLKKILNDVSQRSKLDRIENVLVGGAEISPDLYEKTRSLNSMIYQTFGMTETVTHFALRPLNGPSASEIYEVLPGITIGQDKKGCLTVKGKITDQKKIATNDLIELIDDRSFKWLGRIDHVINTGGVKVIVESLEKKIKSILEPIDSNISFFITGVTDSDLGSRIVMVVEDKGDTLELQSIRNILEDSLGKFERPREYLKTESFCLTEGGKLDRISSLNNSVKINFFY